MKITSIRPQQKIKNRYSIYCDGQYSFSVSESLLLEQGFALGQIVDGDNLKKFKQMSEDDKAYNNALRYAVIRNHSVWEMEHYLKRKNVGENKSDIIISRLTKLGLLDDRNFARNWVENRRLLKTISKRRLEQELRQKHLSNEIIKEALGEDEAKEIDVLKLLIEKKRQQSSYQDKTKLMGYLARQGFSYDDIKRALSEV
jgi:regulatory protein